MISIPFLLLFLLYNCQPVLGYDDEGIGEIGMPIKNWKLGSIIHIKGFTRSDGMFQVALSNGQLRSWTRTENETHIVLYFEQDNPGFVRCFQQQELKNMSDQTGISLNGYQKDSEVNIMIRYEHTGIVVYFDNKVVLSKCPVPRADVAAANYLSVRGIKLEFNNKWVYHAGDNYPVNNTFALPFKVGDYLELLVNLREAPCARRWLFQMYAADKDTPLLLSFKEDGSIQMLRYIAETTTWKQYDVRSNYVSERDKCGIFRVRIQYFEDPPFKGTQEDVLRYFKIRINENEYAFLMPDQRANFTDIIGGQILQFGENNDLVEVFEIRHLPKIRRSKPNPNPKLE